MTNKREHHKPWWVKNWERTRKRGKGAFITLFGLGYGVLMMAIVLAIPVIHEYGLSAPGNVWKAAVSNGLVYLLVAIPVAAVVGAVQWWQMERIYKEYLHKFAS